MTISYVRTPDSQFEGLPDWPYKPQYVEGLPAFNGMRMHYVDEGPINANVTFLCLHGQPTWSYLYRKMIPIFTKAGHRVIAPDFFGFGRSDKPTDEECYSYHFHRNSLMALVDHLKLRNICLVVHDWGGVLGLTLPKDTPSKYTRLLIMNTFLPAGEKASAGFLTLRAYNRSHPDLNISEAIKRVIPHLTPEEAHAYGAPFPDISYKAGVRNFPELLPIKGGTMEGVDTSFAAREFWTNRWKGESFMAVGMQDVSLGPIPMAVMRKMIRYCPEPMELEEASHFVPEWGEPVAQAALEKFGLS